VKTTLSMNSTYLAYNHFNLIMFAMLHGIVVLSLTKSTESCTFVFANLSYTLIYLIF